MEEWEEESMADILIAEVQELREKLDDCVHALTEIRRVLDGITFVKVEKIKS